MKNKLKIPFKEIRKRDGRRVTLDQDKIRNAIVKAGTATGEFDLFEAELLTMQVIKVLSHSHRGGIPGIEQ
ncbi:MAG: hypothetical protein HOC71_02215, partial [Candidatus Latescibacteria bacterium]|nr:hypothetical protein [Candidatus Latescibacterota bacterium]